jgi:hypothetical protein
MGYDSRTPEQIAESIKRFRDLMVEKAKELPLEAGNYILTRDVTNPRSDKRKKYDWRDHAVWKQGTEFVVTETRRMIDFEGEQIPCVERWPSPRSGSSYRFDVRRPYDADDIDAFKLLVMIGSLQKVEAERLGDIFVGRNALFKDQSACLLAILFEKGKITLSDIRDAIKTMESMEPEDYEAFKKRVGL